MPNGKPKIVIVGGGFGGIKLAKLFAKENVDITIVDRHNFHLFQPLLYQVSTSVLSTDEIAYPIRSFFRNNKNVHLFMAKAQGVDQENESRRNFLRLFNFSRRCHDKFFRYERS